jgi:hypothetical protein
VKSILMQRLVKVDGKVRTDTTYPSGFMDVIDIDKTDEHFRLVYDTKGRFVVHRISREEAGYKLCKVGGACQQGSSWGKAAGCGAWGRCQLQAAENGGCQQGSSWGHAAGRFADMQQGVVCGRILSKEKQGWGRWLGT